MSEPMTFQKKSRRERYIVRDDVVRLTRLELARYCYHQPLKLTCLPIPPQPHMKFLKSTANIIASISFYVNSFINKILNSFFIKSKEHIASGINLFKIYKISRCVIRRVLRRAFWPCTILIILYKSLIQKKISVKIKLNFILNYINVSRFINTFLI